MRRRFNVLDFGASNDGITLSTNGIQEAIDTAALSCGEVYLPSGTYLTGALFLKSNINFYLEKGAVLLGTTEESEYPFVFSRVAGIEMEWPAGILNVLHKSNVKIYGEGTINGQGEYWWNKYWGEDRRGGMRREYEEKGLRWAVDYDCTRTRNVIVFESQDIVLEDFSCIRSGFWNVHLCYSENITVRNLTIDENQGPSTDGIDIDSCKRVLVENCTISCNDDNICIKSGRDADGLRVNRICEDIIIRNCKLLLGAGITLGSETSGGMRNIAIRGIEFDGTECGFRLKSARTRGGVIQDITVENLDMMDVSYPFSFQFNWNPAYSYCQVPKDYVAEIPKRWRLLTKKVSKEKGMPYARNIVIKGVKSKYRKKYKGISEAFDIQGFEEAPFEDFTFEDISIEAKKFGKIQGIKNFVWKKITLSINEEN